MFPFSGEYSRKDNISLLTAIDRLNPQPKTDIRDR